MYKRLCYALAAVLLVACGGDSATGPNASVAGNYTLKTVNGQAVPAVIFQDTQEKDELTGGNINLNADNSWTGALSARSTNLSNGAVATISVPASGTYTTNGNGTVTLTDASDNSQLTGTVGGGTLSISGDVGVGVPIVLVFKK